MSFYFEFWDQLKFLNEWQIDECRKHNLSIVMKRKGTTSLYRFHFNQISRSTSLGRACWTMINAEGLIKVQVLKRRTIIYRDNVYAYFTAFKVQRYHFSVISVNFKPCWSPPSVKRLNALYNNGRGCAAWFVFGVISVFIYYDRCVRHDMIQSKRSSHAETKVIALTQCRTPALTTTFPLSQ